MQDTSERIDIHVPEPVRESIRKSAALTGRTMNDFIIAAAFEKAQAVVDSIEHIQLSAEDSRFVMQLLLSPPEKTPALQALSQRIARNQEDQRANRRS